MNVEEEYYGFTIRQSEYEKQYVEYTKRLKDGEKFTKDDFIKFYRAVRFHYLTLKKAREVVKTIAYHEFEDIELNNEEKDVLKDLNNEYPGIEFSKFGLSLFMEVEHHWGVKLSLETLRDSVIVAGEANFGKVEYDPDDVDPIKTYNKYLGVKCTVDYLADNAYEELVGDLNVYLKWLVDAFGKDNAYKPMDGVEAFKTLFDLYDENGKSYEFCCLYLEVLTADEGCGRGDLAVLLHIHNECEDFTAEFYLQFVNLVCKRYIK